MDINARSALLESAGLIVMAAVWNGPAPEPMDVWRPFIGGGAEPDVRIRIRESNTHLPEVQRQWERHAEALGIFGDHGDFLISVAGTGTQHLGWAHVQRTGRMQLPHVLGPVEGEPEFVAVSLDGRVSCGVTTEEYDVWLLTHTSIE